jgi:cell division FtsZ-interacting protein ZapD
LSQEIATAEEEKDLLLSEKKELEKELSKKKQELDEVTKLHVADQEKIAALEEDAERRDEEFHGTKKVLIHICQLCILVSLYLYTRVMPFQCP